MLKYSLSIGWFFTDVPVLERMQLARDAGFGGVDMFWPEGIAVRDLAKAQQSAGIDVAVFNMNEGDYRKGERGFACDRQKRRWWREQFDAALELAAALHCPNINVLSGKISEAGPRAAYLDCIVENLRWAAPRAAAIDVRIVLEPLNHLTHPLQLCQRTTDVLEVLHLVDSANVGLQYDLYHAQRSEGNIIDTMRKHIAQMFHIQVADVPSRGAPGAGELNFPAILHEIEALRYTGYIGLEYQPAQTLSESFRWLMKLESV